MARPALNKPKIPNTNTLIQSGRAARDLIMYNLRSKERTLIGPKFIEQLINEEVDWALKQTKAVSLQMFLNEKGYSSSAYYRWLEMFPELNTIHNDVLAILGAVREMEAIYNKNCNYPVIMLSLHSYSRECLKAEQLKAELKAKAQAQQQTNIVVGIPTYTYNSVEKKEEVVSNVSDNNNK